MTHKLVDIECVIVETVGQAYKVDTGDTIKSRNPVTGAMRELPKYKFLPISQTEVNGDGTVTIPEWLALEKGLI